MGVVSFVKGRGTASSTSVASVSLDESVPPLSASSSSSSLDVTRASFASSIDGVTAGVSHHSRLKKSSASWFMTRKQIHCI